MAARRADAPGRLVPVDAAVVRGIADRGADVAAELEAREPRRERRRRAAGGPAGRAQQVPGIVGGAVDRVEALPVGEQHRDIGLAEDDGARALQALHRKRVLACHVVLEFRHAPGGGPARDVKGLLHRHRQTVQRPALALGAVGGARGLPVLVQVHDADSVQRAVVLAHARGVQVEELERADLLRTQCGNELRGRPEGGIHATPARWRPASQPKVMAGPSVMPGPG